MELIARGRDADVYALDGARVLRRYRHGGPTAREARLMTDLAARGYPVPTVYEVSGADLVLERLDGPTMLDVLAAQPWRGRSLGRTLGGLLDRLHALPAPAWLPGRFGTGGDDRVLHLDLHPGNVVLTGRGPVVIDWRDARAGDPAADVAMTLVIIGSAELPGPALRLARRPLLRSVREGREAGLAARTREVVEVKLADPHLLPSEAARLGRRTGGRTERPGP
ncbi:phosphotransferase [Streptomyces griseoviridis]